MHIERLRGRIFSAMGLSTIALAAVESCTPNEGSRLSQPPAAASTPAGATSVAPPPAVAADPPPDASPPTTTVVTDAAAPAAPTVTAPAPTAVASSARIPAAPQWTATYNRPKEPEWCRTGYAQCFVGTPPVPTIPGEPPLTAKHPASTEVSGCSTTIDVLCECSAHAGCFKQSFCVAPLHAQVTRSERAKKAGACCYAPPQRCPHPGEGRPLRVEGSTRVSRPETRTDWSVPIDLAPIAREAERAELARHWLARAAGEHASIASFSRVALELMALGAPADLIERTHRAALDEIGHARIAYAVAAAYSGEAVGPGPLPTAERHRAEPTFASLGRETFLDACVEETLGVFVLRDEARTAEPALARLIDRIADEETAHAELGWATLAWAVREGGAPARAELETALSLLDGSSPIVRELIVPCARALLATA